MSESYDPNGEPWPPQGGQLPDYGNQPYGQPPSYGQQPSYGQPPSYGQSPTPFGQAAPYGQPGPFDQANPFDQSQGLSANPFDQSQGLNAAPTTPYGQPAGYGQPQPQQFGQPYDQPPPQAQAQPYGGVGPYGQPMQGGYGGQGFYPQPVPPKKSTGKWIAGAAVVAVVIIIIAVLSLGGSKTPSSPTGSVTSTGTPLATASATASGADSATTAPDGTATTSDSGGTVVGSTDYTKGECVNLAGDDNDLVVTEVSCTSANSSGQVSGIVTTGTTGDPTADAALCLPFTPDDNDFEETGDGDGTGVLYCLSATNGEHDLRYATKGSCIYRPSGDDVQTYTVDCSNKLANYVTLGVLSNTTSDSGCDKYSGDEENFFSPDGETPTYVVCAKSK